MALAALGVFYGGVITGIPVVTGVAEGVAEQKKVNAEAANETRMVKFYMDAFCDSDEINGMMVVLKHDKVCIPVPSFCGSLEFIYQDLSLVPLALEILVTIRCDVTGSPE